MYITFSFLFWLLIRKLDSQLDQIGQGVARLKNIALDMNTEIKTQVCVLPIVGQSLYV
jgi:hypothetical protein